MSLGTRLASLLPKFARFSTEPRTLIPAEERPKEVSEKNPKRAVLTRNGRTVTATYDGGTLQLDTSGATKGDAHLATSPAARLIELLGEYDTARVVFGHDGRGDKLSGLELAKLKLQAASIVLPQPLINLVSGAVPEPLSRQLELVRGSDAVTEGRGHFAEQEMGRKPAEVRAMAFHRGGAIKVVSATYKPYAYPPPKQKEAPAIP